jgi:hypothetical protein
MALSEYPAGEPLGGAVLDDHMLQATVPMRGAQKILEAISFRISFSSVSSDLAAKPRILGLKLP